MNISRRSFFAATAGLIAAPAIVRISSIMPVRVHSFAAGELSPALYGRSPAMDALPDFMRLVNWNKFVLAYADALNLGHMIAPSV